MNYLVDPFAGELVEFEKASPRELLSGARDCTKWNPRGQAAMRGARAVRRASEDPTNRKVAAGAGGGFVAGRMSKAATTTNPMFGTNVRSVKLAVPTGGHVSHENDLEVHHVRPRHKGPARGIERYSTGGRHKGPEKGLERYSKRVQFEGGAVIAKRGTPMSELAHTGRQGRRLVTV